MAECVDTPVERLVDLNPSLLRRTTPKDQPFALRLPEGTKAKYEEAIAAIPVDKRVLWRYYKVDASDTLAGIAKKYRTTEGAIAAANNLAATQLVPDAKLVIPASGSIPADGALAYSKHPSRYKARKGDTVLSVADDFGVSPEKLRRWNHLKGNQLRRGRLLVIYKPLAPGEAERVAVSHHRKVHHTASKKNVKANTRTLPAQHSGNTLTARKER